MGKKKGVRTIRVKIGVVVSIVLSRNVCISRFVAATFRKKKKKKKFRVLHLLPFDSNPTIPPSSPVHGRATFRAENFIFFFSLFSPPAVNVTPSNDINVTRACHAFARLFENNRISERSNIFFRE